MTQKVINGENCGKEGASNRIKAYVAKKTQFLCLFMIYTGHMTFQTSFTLVPTLHWYIQADELK